MEYFLQIQCMNVVRYKHGMKGAVKRALCRASKNVTYSERFTNEIDAVNFRNSPTIESCFHFEREVNFWIANTKSFVHESAKDCRKCVYSVYV